MKKRIVITGATGLLGRKHAEAVACYGGTPILLDLSQQAVDSFANELNDKYKIEYLINSIMKFSHEFLEYKDISQDCLSTLRDHYERILNIIDESEIQLFDWDEVEREFDF